MWWEWERRWPSRKQRAVEIGSIREPDFGFPETESQMTMKLAGRETL
jgi:hypothetical protein